MKMTTRLYEILGLLIDDMMSCIQEVDEVMNLTKRNYTAELIDPVICGLNYAISDVLQVESGIPFW
jgi:hypothetical protein